MYRQLLEFVLCVCFLMCLLGMIDCQAPVGGAGDAGAARVDPPGREPQVLIKMQEMEVAGGKEGRRKLEGDQLEALNHKKDEELREKGDVKNVEMQVDPVADDKDQKKEKVGPEKAQGKKQTSLDFIHGFTAAVSIIILSELGDKTFFIAAILSMKHSRWLVFSGAMSANGLMTFLSVGLGFATVIIPRAVTFYISTALMVLFGLKMLYEGWNMSPDEAQEEYEEASEEIQKRKEALTPADSIDAEQALTNTPPRRRLRCFGRLFSPIFLQAFSLTFLGEWGDQSQITTIVLAARENPFGVMLGGTLGHAICTALAVIAGKFVAQKISTRTVTMIGGVMFLTFALTAFLHSTD